MSPTKMINDNDRSSEIDKDIISHDVTHANSNNLTIIDTTRIDRDILPIITENRVVDILDIINLRPRSKSKKENIPLSRRDISTSKLLLNKKQVIEDSKFRFDKPIITPRINKRPNDHRKISFISKILIY